MRQLGEQWFEEEKKKNQTTQYMGITQGVLFVVGS